MMSHTFLHVPGVGQATERKLWERGFLRWEDYLERRQYCPLPQSIHTRLVGHLTESVEALAAGYARYFEMRLPPSEVWRLYREFREKAAFVDIETTGLYPSGDSITVIGLFNGRETRVFIRGLNLDEFAEEIGKYSLIVTFNGKHFDMPFIRRLFGELPRTSGTYRSPLSPQESGLPGRPEVNRGSTGSGTRWRLERSRRLPRCVALA